MPGEPQFLEIKDWQKYQTNLNSGKPRPILTGGQMTLWELAQSWRERLDSKCAEELEQWALEKAKEYQEAMKVPNAVGLRADLVIDDLGVPEDDGDGKR